MNRNNLNISLHFALAAIIITVLAAALKKFAVDGISLFPLMFLSFLAIILLFFIFVNGIRIEDERDPVLSAGKNELKPDFSGSENKIRETADQGLILERVFSGLKKPEDMQKFGKVLLRNMAEEFEIVQGIVYLEDSKKDEFTAVSGYAVAADGMPDTVIRGSGITGQAAADGKVIEISPVPENYRMVLSGLGNSKPSFIYIIPFVHGGRTNGILEFSTFQSVTHERFSLLNNLSSKGGSLLNELKENA